MEKGRENCRVYVEERKLSRMARETGMSPDDIIEGVAAGELGGSSDASK